MIRRRVFGVVTGLTLISVALLSAAVPALAVARTGQVFVLNAVVGSPADVVLDGRVIRPGLAPKAVLGPLDITVGKHVLALNAGSRVLAKASFTVQAGRSIDLVAHRMSDASMNPTITVFPNLTTSVGRGKARLVVSHVAVAPPADIRVDGKALFRNVANGESLSLIVPAKTYSVDIVPTSTAGPEILAPVRLTIRPGTLTRVFAVGDATAGTTDAMVQVIKVRVSGSAAPTLVRTGDGGQAAVSFVGPGAPAWLLPAVTALVGLVLLGFGRGVAAGRDSFGGRHTR